MNTTIKAAGAAVAMTFILAGCASPGMQQSSQAYPSQQAYPTQQSYPTSSQSNATMYGVIDTIQMLQGAANTSPGLGTVAGVVVGGLLGNQVGGGNGKAVATVAGAVGGGLIGNNIENRNRAAGPSMYQIGVRLDNGTYQTVTQDSAADLGVGNRVRVDGGRVYRY